LISLQFEQYPFDGIKENQISLGRGKGIFVAKSSIKLKKSRKPTVHRQVAALPYRRKASGEIEVLLLTSRTTHRLIIPKGWRSGLKGWKAAKIEAYEEAGLIGRIKHRPFDQFEYWKRTPDHFELINVDVYPLMVEKRLKEWPEKRQRVMKWLSGADAALLVDEPRLVTLIREFCGVDGDGEMVPDRRPKSSERQQAA
jgi:8-oxo-dGTP pyrophosphatase MutT (NUDIX family)